MSIFKRKRNQFSSPMINEVEAQGLSYLCFAEDASWFQGNIQTEDESNYSIYGEKAKIPLRETPALEEEKLEIAEEYYNVTLIDHFSGLSYTLPRIMVNKRVLDSEVEALGDSNLFTCKGGSVCFNVENVYRGQRADMIIQKYLCSANLLNKNCLVYSGPMSISFDDDWKKNEKSWCL